MTSLAMGNYVNAIFPQIPVNAAAFATVSLFFVINLFGLKAMSRIQNILVILLLSALIVFIVFGLPNLRPGSFTLSSDLYFTGGVSGFISAVVLLSSSTTSHQLMFGLAAPRVTQERHFQRLWLSQAALYSLSLALWALWLPMSCPFQKWPVKH